MVTGAPAFLGSRLAPVGMPADASFDSITRAYITDEPK